MDGMIGAQGDMLYQTKTNDVKIKFIFVQDNIVILSTSERRILKVRR
jgi:hypothetical protein